MRHTIELMMTASLKRDAMYEYAAYVYNNFDRALEDGWIEVFFQPIVRSLTGEVCEFEVLSRWNDPQMGFLQPNEFIGVLEASRLIHRLDAYMVRKACEVWRKLTKDDASIVPFSVNLSRLDFELCDAFELVDSAAREFAVPRQMLHVEITESALNDASSPLASEIRRFREAGYQVWLDDFGSGYSSLNTLKDYAFDVVKIDMAFLHDFDAKPKSRVIIASIVNMAKQLGMQTLIEGVETPEQFDYLRGIGCEFAQGYLVGRPASLVECRRRIDAGELVLGQNALYGYYDRLGAINSLSATPFEFPWDLVQGERPFAEMLPLATVEREGDVVRFISQNDAFVSMLREVGLGSMAEVAELVSHGVREQSHIVRGAMETAIASGSIESVDLLINGHHCVLRVRHVVSHGGVDALLVSFMNLSRFSEVGEDKRQQIALRYLYAVYEEANIVDLTDGTVHTIYRGNSSFPAVGDGVLFEDSVHGFANTYVHPDDRARCVRYLDLRDLPKRLEASGRSYLAEGFRTLRPDGTYGWLVSVLVPVYVDGSQAVLVCVRQANQSVLADMMGEETIPKALLWDTLMDLVPAGVFWKDRQRRFLGVNKNFLDFYGFASVNEVLGKTDEDMGWHVDVDPFKNYELAVVEQGKPVLNANGTCIARGEVHDIRASKIPLRRNGEVVGLMGYFMDRNNELTSQGELHDGFVRMAATDGITGIPNMRGLTSSLLKFQDAYDNGGPDCVYAIMSIQGMRDLNAVYGRTFGNRILKVTAARLTQACGVTGVLARAGGIRFCYLHQVHDATDAQTKLAHLEAVVGGVRDVDGSRVRLRCTTGWALFSEGADISEVVFLAERRLREA